MKKIVGRPHWKIIKTRFIYALLAEHFNLKMNQTPPKPNFASLCFKENLLGQRINLFLSFSAISVLAGIAFVIFRFRPEFRSDLEIRFLPEPDSILKNPVPVLPEPDLP